MQMFDPINLKNPELNLWFLVLYLDQGIKYFSSYFQVLSTFNSNLVSNQGNILTWTNLARDFKVPKTKFAIGPKNP